MSLTFTLLLFYLFAGILTISSIVVITASNMIVAIMFLILAFILIAIGAGLVYFIRRKKKVSADGDDFEILDE